MSVIYTSAVYTKSRKDGEASPKYSYYLTVDLQSQDIVNNTSTVLFTLLMYTNRNGSSEMWDTNVDSYAARSSITVEGVTYNSSSNVDQGSNGSGLYIVNGGIREYTARTTTLEICKETLTIPHNSDGTKSIAISFNWIAGPSSLTNVYYPKSFASNGATISLTAIPRQSIINCNSSVTLNNNTSNFSYTVKSYADYYHVLSWTLDGTTTNVWTSGSPHRVNNTTETLTISYGTLLNALKSGATKTLTFTLKTYNNSALGTLIGTTTKSVSVSINTTVYKPTLSLTGITPNTTPIAGKLVAGKSSATVAFSSAKPQGTTGLTIYFSTNKGSMASATSTTVGSGSVNTNTLPTSESSNYTFTITAYAVDSRGVSSGNVTLTSPTVYAYKQPVITASAYRVASNGSTTADDAGDYVYITYSATCSSVNSSNSIQSTDCTYNLTSYSSGTWASLSVDNQGQFDFTATDLVMTATKTIIVPTAKFPLDLYDDGTAQHMGVGIAGAMAEPDKVKSAKNIFVDGSSGWIGVKATRTDTQVVSWLQVGSGGANHGLYSDGYNDGTYHSDSKWMVYRNSSGDIILNGNANTATTATNATNASKLATWPSKRPASATGNSTWDASMTHFLSTSTTTDRPQDNFGYITDWQWDNNNGILGTQMYIACNQDVKQPIAMRGSSSNVWNTWNYVPTYKELWTGTCQGGSSVSLSLGNNYRFIRVYVSLFKVDFYVDVDLTHKPNKTVAAGSSNTAYRGSSSAPVYATGAGTQRAEIFYCVVEVPSAKTSVSILQMGYIYSSGSRQDRNSNADYFAYKIEGYL